MGKARICAICRKRKTIQVTYYFCTICYKKFNIAEALKDRKEWLLELIKSADRERYSNQKYEKGTASMKTKVKKRDYEWDYVEDLLNEQAVKEHRTDEYGALQEV